MHLSPRDREKLALHDAGFLAQKRLARGLRLNQPESVALIATQILELIRDGKSVAELMDLGRRLLGRSEVMDGVPEMIDDVQVEGTFADGTKLVTVHHPIVAEHGDLALALYGSFLPQPAPGTFPTVVAPSVASTTSAALGVFAGQRFDRDEDIVINEGRATLVLAVTNTGDRPIQVGSHYHFFETNRALEFEREPTHGMHLDIPAGTAVRFEPGDTKTVRLVAGRRRRHGDAATPHVEEERS